MKSGKDPQKRGFNPGHLMYITVIIASLGLLFANVLSGTQKEKIRVVCESGTFFDSIKEDYPRLDVVVEDSGITKARDDNFSNSSSTDASQLININSASADELKTLTGIGETKAAAIIQYRTDNGGFKSIEEICRVKGIGDATFNKIRDRITV